MKTEPIEQEKAEKPAQDPEVQRQFDQLDGLLSDFTPEPEQEGAADQSGSTDAQPAMESGEMCAALLSVLFTLMASRRGDHWMLSDAEGEMLGNALAAVLDKYMPGMKGGPEATLIIVALMIVGPRAVADQKVKKQKVTKLQPKADKPDQEAQAAAPEPEPEPGRGEGFEWIKEAA